LDYLDTNNKNVIFALSLRQEISMSNDKELKARIKEREEDLRFYLRKYHELASRSRNMKAVVDAEIKRLEEEIKSLGAMLH
jgi:uncharacterized membrane protein